MCGVSGVTMTQQVEHITKALLVFGPLYGGWLTQQLPVEYQSVKTRLMVMLMHTPQMSMRYYARLLGISKAHMTTLVDECIQSGFIIRTVDVHDRRATQLSLTPAGMKLAGQIWLQYVAQTATSLDAVSEADRAVFLSVCVQLTERMHAMGCGSGMTSCDGHVQRDHDPQP
jgi:DNA-binding MarR family transcriptional regulator